MHFKSFSETVQISGDAVLSSLKALAEYSISIDDLLKKHNYSNVQSGNWYNLQTWLNILKDVWAKYGPNTMFTLGKGVANNVPELGLDFRGLLSTINHGYKMNHINGDAGMIELVEFNQEARWARLKSITPYPPEYGRGVLVGIIRKFKPVPGAIPKVEIEKTNDEDINYLNITW